MFKKVQHLQKIYDSGVVAVIRAENGEEALKITEAIKKGGLSIIEITMTVPGAVEVIKELSNEFDEDEVLIGAGSVLDSETARSCLLAGAEFIVSPTIDAETIELCNRYNKIVMPGAMSVNEVQRAMELGSDIVKVFPASLFGPKIIKSIKGPLPQANLLPTGGINLQNVRDYLKAGSFAVGVGSTLTKGAKEGDYNKITEVSKNFVEIINSINR